MSLTAPHLVMERLAEIDKDLELRQNELEQAALDWFRAKREQRRNRAAEFMRHAGSGKTMAERSALADQATALEGMEEEAAWESQKAVLDVLKTRSSIGQSILKAQSR